MPQTRYWDYGSPVPQDKDNFVNKALNNPGVYNGLELSLNSDGNLIITPGDGLQPDGVIWEEDADILYGFTPPGAATDYTIYATHTDQRRTGGSPVEYEDTTGIITSVSGGVIIGWIRHPGGGVSLETRFIQNAPKQNPTIYANEAVALRGVNLFPEFPQSYYDSPASGPNTSLIPKVFTSVGQFLTYQEASNGAGAPGFEQLVQHFVFFIEDGVPRPIGFDFYANIPSSPNNRLIVQVYDTDQVLVPSLPGSPIISTAGWEHKSVEVDRSMGVWDSGKPFSMRLLFQMDPGQNIQLGRIKAKFWPYS